MTTPKEFFETLSRHKIIIKHPAYDEHGLSNEMITLPAWDREEGGLHFGTVHLACAIIACNAFYGFLSQDRAGKDTVKLDPEEILPAGAYYFHVPHPSATETSPYR
jgi:hypothetical protein